MDRHSTGVAERVPSADAPAGPRRLGPLLAGLVSVLALLAVLAPGFAVACARPLDLNKGGTTAPGGLVDTLLSETHLIFGAHVVVGTVLAAAGCDGGAVGLQWLKAGWHAGTPQQEATVAAGLRRAAELAGGPRQLEQAICPFFPVAIRPSQDRSLRQAGLHCDVAVVEVG